MHYGKKAKKKKMSKSKKAAMLKKLGKGSQPNMGKGGGGY